MVYGLQVLFNGASSTLHGVVVYIDCLVSSINKDSLIHSSWASLFDW